MFGMWTRLCKAEADLHKPFGRVQPCLCGRPRNLEGRMMGAVDVRAHWVLVYAAKDAAQLASLVKRCAVPPTPEGQTDVVTYQKIYKGLQVS